MSEHHENCDVNDINPDGIVKPCNCGKSSAPAAAGSLAFECQRASGVPCGNTGCFHHNRSMEQHCDGECVDGDPAPSACEHYFPTQEND